MATDERTVDRPDGWPKQLSGCIVGVLWADIECIRGGGWDGYPSRYEISSAVPNDTVELARTYWKAYRDLCAPLDDLSLSRLLLGLRDMTVRKSEEGSDWQVTLENWSDALQPYPADIVLWALEFWKNNERFWPTWSEFKQLLDRRVAARSACMDALKRIGEMGQRPQTQSGTPA